MSIWYHSPPAIAWPLLQRFEFAPSMPPAVVVPPAVLDAVAVQPLWLIADGEYVDSPPAYLASVAMNLVLAVKFDVPNSPTLLMKVAESSLFTIGTGRGIRLWDDLRHLERGYDVASLVAESGVIHVTFTRPCVRRETRALPSRLRRPRLRAR